MKPHEPPGSPGALWPRLVDVVERRLSGTAKAAEPTTLDDITDARLTGLGTESHIDLLRPRHRQADHRRRGIEDPPDRVEVVLEPVTRAGFDEHPGAVAGQRAALLAEITDGTPFAILEVICSLEQQRALHRDGHVWRPAGADTVDRTHTEARAGQRRSIIVRAERQPVARRGLLALLALLGRPAPARLLAEATGMTPAGVVAEMDGLVRAELVRHDERGWAVAHDLVGQTLGDGLEPIERARFHQQLARVLEDAPDTAGERARHLAGAGDRPAARAAYATAARRQLERFADREAERLAQAGLELDPSDAARGELLEVRVETRARTGRLPAARDDLRAALRLAGTPIDRSACSPGSRRWRLAQRTSSAPRTSSTWHWRKRGTTRRPGRAPWSSPRSST
jgi:hypothetical protein